MQDLEDLSDPETPAATKAVTILFAEDDPFLREVVAAQFRAHDYRIIEAESGDQALSLLERGDIVLLMTDICMPGELDGWALAEKARSLHPQLQVIYASSQQADAARQVSGSLYLRKPYRMDECLTAAETLIRARTVAGAP